jgi:hypothetical protein
VIWFPVALAIRIVLRRRRFQCRRHPRAEWILVWRPSPCVAVLAAHGCYVARCREPRFSRYGSRCGSGIRTNAPAVAADRTSSAFLAVGWCAEISGSRCLP